MDKEEYQRICQLQKTHRWHERMRRASTALLGPPESNQGRQVLIASFDIHWRQAIVRNGILPIRAPAFGLTRGRPHVAVHTRCPKPSDRASN